ncbi:MAG: TetR/AcrR family transcriptional regulator [Alkaliphilus sp.]
MQVKKERVRKIIVESAKELFIANGFKSTTVKMIADDAGMAVANIYNYFGNKEELLSHIVKEGIDSCNKYIGMQSLEKVWANPSKWTVDSETDRIVNFARNLFQYREEFVILFSKAHGSKLENFYEELVENLIAIKSKIATRAIEMGIIKMKAPRFISESVIRMHMQIITEGLSKKISEAEVENRLKASVRFSFFGYSEYIENLTILEGKELSLKLTKINN